MLQWLRVAYGTSLVRSAFMRKGSIQTHQANAKAAKYINMEWRRQ